MFMDKTALCDYYLLSILIYKYLRRHESLTVFQEDPASHACVQTLKQLPAATNEHNTGREREKTEEVTADEHDRVLGVFQLLRR